MGVLAPGSAYARPYAVTQPTMDMSKKDGSSHGEGKRMKVKNGQCTKYMEEKRKDQRRNIRKYTRS